MASAGSGGGGGGAAASVAPGAKKKEKVDVKDKVKNQRVKGQTLGEHGNSGGGVSFGLGICVEGGGFCLVRVMKEKRREGLAVAWPIAPFMGARGRQLI